MKSFFKTFFAALLAGIVLIGGGILLTIGLISALAMAGESTPVVPEKTILTVELSGPWYDRAVDNPIAALFGADNGGQDLSALTRALTAAATDDRIKAVYLRASGMGPGYTTAFEIRQALQTFKESGKPIYIYGTIYDQRSLLVGALADSVLIHPEGMAEWYGLGAQIPSFAGMLRKVGVEPQIIRATGNSFKSAVEPFFLDSISAENRMQTETLLTQIWDEMLAAIAKDRGLTEEALDSMATDLTIESAADLVKSGLADAQMQADEVLTLLGDKTGEADIRKVPMTTYQDYAATLAKGKYTGDKLAVIYAEGEIVFGEGSDDYSITTRRYVNALREARMDPKIKAVLLRVNSPGGSSLVSDLIAREIDLTAQEKPVIVSMGNVAASGGYYISTSAQKIFVSPTTITGSIGVFGTLFSAQELLNEKMGIRFDEVKTNPHAGLLVPDQPMSPAVAGYFQKMVDRTYATFIQRVAEGRNLPLEQVAEHAKGRVWTGSDALRHGLADTLGGLSDALKYAAQQGGLGDAYRVVELPEAEDPFARFTQTVKNLPEAWLREDLGPYGEVLNGFKSLNSADRVLMRMEYDLLIQ
jgi:protease-4